MVGHPEGLADLFLDRSLGSRRVPSMLREAGLRLRTLVEVYGSPADERVTDQEWLSLAGERGWVVLMKDQRIRYNEVEKDAVLRHGVMAFCLSGGNLSASQMAAQFLAVVPQMAGVCRGGGPFIYAVTGSGMRRADL